MDRQALVQEGPEKFMPETFRYYCHFSRGNATFTIFYEQNLTFCVARCVVLLH